jgi:hypothetical protein
MTNPCTCGHRIGDCDSSCQVGTPQPSTAIADRREQISSLARPAKLSDISIKQEVQEARDSEDIFRLYRQEWVEVFTSHALGAEGAAEAYSYFGEKYEGRVYPDDVAYVPGSPTTPTKVKLRLPNLRGEFKFAFLANRFAEEQGFSDWQIVAKNSKADYLIKDYSRKKLPSVKE